LLNDQSWHHVINRVCHDIAEILQKLALNTNQSIINRVGSVEKKNYIHIMMADGIFTKYA
jgi:hypothetical protein